MIASIVDYALNNRFIVLSVAAVLFVWGIVAFKRLPVEAYPDVANTWVQVITQWPGRAAEEVEQPRRDGPDRAGFQSHRLRLLVHVDEHKSPI
jgi:hypothetical protein